MQMTVAAIALLWARSTAPAIPWNELAGYYQYTPSAQLRVVEEAQKLKGLDEATHVIFPACNGQSASGLFMKPEGLGKYPVVMLLHGLAGTKENALRQMAKPLLASGCAVFALDAPYHGESRTKEGDAILARMYTELAKVKSRRDLIAEAAAGDTDHSFEDYFTSLMHDGVINYRMGMDYLQHRPDVDPRRIHLWGSSMGAIMGAILGAVDPRVKSLCLSVGGDPLIMHIDPTRPESRERLLRVSPSLYIPRFHGPLLMINGLSDETIPSSTAALLFDQAVEPKEIRWYPTGHQLNPQAKQDALTWLIKQTTEPIKNGS